MCQLEKDTFTCFIKRKKFEAYTVEILGVCYKETGFHKKGHTFLFW